MRKDSTAELFLFLANSAVDNIDRLAAAEIQCVGLKKSAINFVGEIFITVLAITTV